MAAWPASLPQGPFVGHSEGFPDELVRTKMDAGPAKVRRRYTASVIPIEYPIQLTTAQVTTLRTFYYTTLNGGVDTFTHDLPRTGVAATLRFTAPPKPRVSAVGTWQVVLMLEILPSA